MALDVGISQFSYDFGSTSSNNAPNPMFAGCYNLLNNALMYQSQAVYLCVPLYQMGVKGVLMEAMRCGDVKRINDDVELQRALELARNAER